MDPLSSVLPYSFMCRLQDAARPGQPYANPFIHHARIRGQRARTLVPSTYKEVERTYAASVNAMDISSEDGRFLLSGGGDGSVVIHGLSNFTESVKQIHPVVGKVLANSSFAHEFALSACQFYPHDHGAFTTSGKDGKVKVWDTRKMTPVHKFTFPLPVIDHHMSLLKSAKPLIAAACMDKTIRICDLRTLSSVQTLSGHSKPVNCVRWSRHAANCLASGGADGKIALWDVRKARSCLAYLDANNAIPSTDLNANSLNFAHESAVVSLEFSESGTHLVSLGADHRLRTWSTVSGKNTLVNYGKVEFAFRDLHRHLQLAVTSLASPDLIFVPSRDKILVFDMVSGERLTTLTAHFQQVLTCAYHPHFQSLFSGATDRSIEMWTPETDFCDIQEEKEAAKKYQMNRWAKRQACNNITATLTADTWSDED
ncbi:hypothetical protein RvY_08530 [Ramazzottius varieornatus]|uniref:Uncharacterized protein n=1 Tax=Ramazzottius varieornatus TaxID=947166 RepID=A0A1D1VFC2_RAMVA|nr:hypothetical protein RvY_08530 [Ramazzottius varieornatus]